MLSEAHKQGHCVSFIHTSYWQHPTARVFARAVVDKDFKGSTISSQSELLAFGLYKFVDNPVTYTAMTLEKPDHSITSESLAAIPSTITNITLNLGNNITITNEGLAALPKTITNMTLALKYNNKITNEGLAALPKAITNMTLALRHNYAIKNEDLTALPKTITNMTLNLEESCSITNEGLAALPK